METEQMAEILRGQRALFNTGITRSIGYRLGALSALKGTLITHQAEISEALKQDLNKSELESYATEIGLVLSEITYVTSRLRGWARPKRVSADLSQLPAKSRVFSEPYGCVLIMSPWNYPFQLSLIPLIDAIAAGNCVVIKPSNYSKNVSALIARLIDECFEPELVSVVLGGREENAALLEQKFDYIFFTGSADVGRLVMSKAAQHLTPVTLELGGKSPCIIEKTANIPLAAKRIAWGKLINAGQTCIAPDYILVQREIKDEFVRALKAEFVAQVGEKPFESSFYPAIINDKHFVRLKGLIAGEDIAYGGQANEETRQIAPTILAQANFQSKAMGEEIFGPIFPVIAFDTIDEVLERLSDIEKPLALYLFTRDKKLADRVISMAQYGGGCINDILLHVASHKTPFGGVGESGMGGYHGRAGFDTFSHRKTVLISSIAYDPALRYIHYGQKYLKLIKNIMK